MKCLVPLSGGSKEKTAFATPGGLSQYRMMPFGLSGAPAIFQRLMDQVLKPHQEYAAAYLDDMVIHIHIWLILECIQTLHSRSKTGELYPYKHNVSLTLLE